MSAELQQSPTAATMSPVQELSIVGHLSISTTTESPNLVFILSLTIGIVVFLGGLAILLYSLIRGGPGSSDQTVGSPPAKSAQSKRNLHQSAASKRSIKVSPCPRPAPEPLPKSTGPPSALDSRFGAMDSQLWLNVDVAEPSRSDLSLDKFDVIKQGERPPPPNSPKRLKVALPVVVTPGAKGGANCKSRHGHLRTRQRSASSRVKRLALLVPSPRRPCSGLKLVLVCAGKKSREKIVKSRSKSSRVKHISNASIRTSDSKV